MNITKRELVAIVHAGGLETDGKETIADLTEALAHLAQAWKTPYRGTRHGVAARENEAA